MREPCKYGENNCQFPPTITKTHDFVSDVFCCMHTPTQEKIGWSERKKKLYKTAFDTLINKQQTDFTGVHFMPSITHRFNYATKVDSLIIDHATIYLLKVNGEIVTETVVTDSQINVLEIAHVKYSPTYKVSKNTHINKLIIHGTGSDLHFEGCEIDETLFNNTPSDTATIEFVRCIFNCAPENNAESLSNLLNFYSCVFTDLKDGHAIGKYRKFRTQMQATGNRQQQGVFYCMEQRAMRNAHSGVTKVISYLYDLISEYGTNYRRPLLWLLGIQIVSFIAYSFTVQIDHFGRLLDIFVFSLSQTVKPFSALTNYRTLSNLGIIDTENYRVISTISIVQSISMLTVFSAFVISIRWQFKKE